MVQRIGVAVAGGSDCRHPQSATVAAEGGDMSEETDFKAVVSAVTVLHRGARLNDDTATRISLDDEGGGAFVVIEQDSSAPTGRVAITPEEWPEIRRAIDDLMVTAEGMK